MFMHLNETSGSKVYLVKKWENAWAERKNVTWVGWLNQWNHWRSWLTQSPLFNGPTQAVTYYAKEQDFSQYFLTQYFLTMAELQRWCWIGGFNKLPHFPSLWWIWYFIYSYDTFGHIMLPCFPYKNMEKQWGPFCHVVSPNCTDTMTVLLH